MQITAKTLYRLDQGDQELVLEHWEQCDNCTHTFKEIAEGETLQEQFRLTSNENLCIEARDYLEHGGRDPEQGFIISFRKGEHRSKILTQLQEAEQRDGSTVRAEKDGTILFIPSDGFLTMLLTQFLEHAQH